jgi:deoxyadenosine/deoxycytidine kinase
MYADLPRWGFHSQVHFLVTSARRHRQLAALVAEGEAGPALDRPPSPLPVVEDRTPYEHRAVYLAVQEELGLLPHDEIAVLTDLAVVLERAFLVPDVLIHRRVRPSQADERIRRRARPGEEHMDARWLAAVAAAFDAMAADWTRCPVVDVGEDVDADDPSAVTGVLATVAGVLARPAGSPSDSGNSR